MALARKLQLQMIDVYGDDTITVTFDRVNPEVDYKVLDTAMRQFVGMTRNTYLDTRVVDTQSLNNLVAD